MGVAAWAGSVSLLRSDRPRCDRPVRAVDATRVAGTTTEVDLRSFDGTVIRLHWMPRLGGERAPTVLMGPGWGSTGAVVAGPGVAGTLSALDLDVLRGDGYNVLTWDPRGFGASGGRAEFDASAVEGADVSAIIDWLATQPTAALDRAGDPRVAMAGSSYGGAIGLIASARDCRVDAVVAMFTWHALDRALFPAETPKLPWLDTLVSLSDPQRTNPHLADALTQAQRNGVVDPADLAWFRRRGVEAQGGAVTAPTLLIQGIADNLLDLDEAIATYRSLRARGVAVSMVWVCGGHGQCLPADADPASVTTPVRAWLDRYLMRSPDAPKLPRFQVDLPNGGVVVADDYPVPTGTTLEGKGAGTLALTEQGGGGEMDPARLAPLARLAHAERVTPAPAQTALTVQVAAADRSVALIGAPRVTMTYRATSPPGTRPGRMYVQLVDPRTSSVVGNAVTPVPIQMDGAVHAISVTLPSLALRLDAGQHIELQVMATSSLFPLPRLGGELTVSALRVTVPVASAPPRVG